MTWETVLEVAKRAVISILVVINCLPTAFSARFQNKKAEDVLLNAVITADLHTDGDITRDRNNELRKRFTAVTEKTGKTDAFILAGDLTNSGDEKEYTFLMSMLTAYTSSEKYIPAMGNHDSWHHSDDPDFGLATKYYQNFCRFCSIKSGKNYYSAKVNGYTFISLGTEALSHNQATFSGEQLKWFDGELAKAAADNKPVFVICHQTLAGKNGTGPADDSGCIGEQSGEVEGIMKKYADDGMTILFISGHMHESVSSKSLDRRGSIYYLNLPSFQYDENEYFFLMNVYADRIVLEAAGLSEEQGKYVFEIKL